MAPVGCPCGSGHIYVECCGPFHRDLATPPTAESLTRSRFSAFAVDDAPYLLRTWHPRTRPRKVQLDPRQRWTRLEIIDRLGGGLLDSDGMVEFRAHYARGKRADSMHERSQFARHESVWRYLGPMPVTTGGS
jgi:SEC-C motif-containing protein